MKTSAQKHAEWVRARNFYKRSTRVFTFVAVEYPTSDLAVRTALLWRLAGSEDLHDTVASALALGGVGAACDLLAQEQQHE